MLRRITATATSLGALIASVVGFPTSAWASTPIVGGGSGFAALEISQWQADVASPSHGSLRVDYSSQSSGIGRQYFAVNSWDYAASDIRYIPVFEDSYLHQMQAGRCGGRPPAACFVYVPVSAGGLGLMYNLTNPDGSRMTTLRLTPTDVCGIFTGRITNWSQLASNNGALQNSQQQISPVVRQDEAGESYVLSQYCIAEDPTDWTTFVKFQTGNPCAANQEYSSQDAYAFANRTPIPTWPSVLLGCRTVQTANGSDGVANTVADPTQGPGSITYNAAGYALVRNFPNASVQNAAGVFTQPNATSVTIALEFASAVGDGTFRLDFSERRGADPRAYNPSTYSYILAQTGGFDPGRGSTLGRFLCYAIGQGQTHAAALLYAPLSSQVTAISEAAALKVPGAPSASACLSGARPAPPPPPLTLVHPVSPGSGTGSGVSATGSANGSSLNGRGVGQNGAGSGASKKGSCRVRSSNSSSTSARNSVPPRNTPIRGAKVATTTTTIPCSANGNVAGNAGGANGNYGGSSSTTLPAVLTSAPHHPTNFDALTLLVEGAAVCAIGVGFAGVARRREA